MITKLVLASNNPHKVDEIKTILGDDIEVVTLRDIDFQDDIEETGTTIEENATIKAKAIRSLTHLPVLSDDSGLEVSFLNNAPGVHSARYAGEEKSDEKNYLKLLHDMKGANNRSARFKTVLCLAMPDDQTHFFEGIIPGHITESPRGTNGFGYDPVFQPDGFTQTFAELSEGEKNSISHRKRALEKLLEHLNDQ